MTLIKPIESDADAAKIAAADAHLRRFKQTGRQEAYVGALLGYGRLLEYFRKLGQWDSWVQIQGNLAILHRTKYEFSESPAAAEDSEEALTAAREICYSQSLMGYLPKVLNSLGLLSLTRLQLSMNDRERQKAASQLKEAIELWIDQSEDDPKASYNLALSYTAFFKDSGDASYVEKAEAAFRDARANWPVNNPDWPTISIDLSEANLCLRRWDLDPRDLYLNEAIRFARSAAGFARRSGAIRHLAMAQDLGAKIFVRRKQWSAAAESLNTVLQKVPSLLLESGSRDEHLRLLKQFVDMSGEYSVCLVKAKQPAAALIAADAYRAYLLTTRLNLQRQAMEEGGADEWREVQQALLSLELIPTIDTDALANSAKSRAAIRDQVAEFQHRARLRSQLNLGALPLMDKTAIIFFVMAFDQLDAFLVQHGCASHFRLGPLPKEDLQQLLYSSNASCERCDVVLRDAHRAVVDAPGHRADAECVAVLSKLASNNPANECGYYNSYHMLFSRLARRLNAPESRRDAAKQAAAARFDKSLASVTTFLRERIRAILDPALAPDISTLLLAGTQELSLLPLHLGWEDEFNVGIIPSIASWSALQSRACGVRQHRRIAIMAPAKDLLMTELEAYFVCKRFEEAGGSATFISGERATVAQFKNVVTQFPCLHFAGHAQFGWQYLDFTQIRLRDGVVSMRQLQQCLDVEHPEFVFLSACESGLVDTVSFADEISGLVGTLFERGASTVVSSSWPVWDLFAPFYCDEFYRLILGTAASAHEAARGAANWTRTATRRELLERIAGIPVAKSVQQFLNSLGIHAAQNSKGLSPEFDSDRLSEAVESAVMFLETSDTETPFESPRHWGAFASYGAQK